MQEASPQVLGHIFSFFLSLPSAHRNPGTEELFPQPHPIPAAFWLQRPPSSWLFIPPSAGPKSQTRNSCGVRLMTQTTQTEPRENWFLTLHVCGGVQAPRPPSLRASSDSDPCAWPCPVWPWWLGNRDTSWLLVCQKLTVEGGLDANRNDKGKGRRKTGFPSVGASLPGVGRVTHLGLAASAAQPEASTARSWEPGTLGDLSPAFPICFPSWAETENWRPGRWGKQTTALEGHRI